VETEMKGAPWAPFGLVSWVFFLGSFFVAFSWDEVGFVLGSVSFSSGASMEDAGGCLDKSSGRVVNLLRFLGTRAGGGDGGGGVDSSASSDCSGCGGVSSERDGTGLK